MMMSSEIPLFKVLVASLAPFLSYKKFYRKNFIGIILSLKQQLVERGSKASW